MAWRPHQYLIKGELDNTEPNRVRGSLQFHGVTEPVQLDLVGNFHRDIRGTRIRLKGELAGEPPNAAKCMASFATRQTGKVGDITAGLPPQDYVGYPYVEWYSEENGRVVLELQPHQLEVIGTPVPWQETEPINRAEQARNMGEFLQSLAREARVVPVPVAGRVVQ